MRKFLYKLKNLFKSPQQIEIESRMEFERNKRSFEKYYQELDVSAKKFSKMAREAEMSGNHANALSCVKFVQTIQRSQTKVQALIQRFEMLHHAQRLGNVFTTFAKACNDIGVAMDATIDLKGLGKTVTTMEMSLGKLDALSEGMDLVFDSIDKTLVIGMGELQTESESEAEAEELLDRIMGRYNTGVMQQEATVPKNVNEASREAAANDPDEEKLRSMMEELS